MLKFFRRIRQNLIMENKVSKYLLYAIGEIVLVVIGILIALSINNWNTENKNHDLEKDLLLGIQSDLVRDTTQMTNRFYRSYNNLKQTIAVFDSLVKLKNPEIEMQVLDSIFKRCIRQRNTFWPNSGTYKSIVNNGTSNIIRNNDLYKRIQILHDVLYELILSSGTRVDNKSDQLRYKFNNVNTLNKKEKLIFYRNMGTRNEIEYWYTQINDFKKNIDFAHRQATLLLIDIEQEINTSF